MRRSGIWTAFGLWTNLGLQTNGWDHWAGIVLFRGSVPIPIGRMHPLSRCLRSCTLLRLTNSYNPEESDVFVRMSKTFDPWGLLSGVTYLSPRKRRSIGRCKSCDEMVPYARRRKCTAVFTTTSAAPTCPLDTGENSCGEVQS